MYAGDSAAALVKGASSLKGSLHSQETNINTPVGARLVASMSLAVYIRTLVAPAVELELTTSRISVPCCTE